MADKPILLKDEMVCATLDLRKTQTRRLLKLRKYDGFFQFGPSDTPGYDWTFRRKDHVWEDFRHNELLKLLPVQKGDRLWVKETWRVGAWLPEHWARGPGECNAKIAVDYLADDYARQEWIQGADAGMMLRLMDDSRADAEEDGNYICDDNGGFRWKPGESPCRTRPSIHMPRWASRITLLVTDVRVERLQDISQEDAIAEGIEETKHPAMLGKRTWQDYATGRGILTEPRDSFRTLWNSINGPDAWDANPWVAAYTFEPVFQNIDLIEATA